MNIADPIVDRIVEGPPAERPTVQINFRTTPSRDSALKEICAAYGKSQEKVLNELLVNLIERYDAAIAAKQNQT